MSPRAHAEGRTVRDGNGPTVDGPGDTGSLSGQGTTAPRAWSGGPGGGGGRGSEPGSVHVIMDADRTRIVLSGEVDADLGPDLIDATADAEAAGLPIEVDTHHVTFMDSSGVAFLARLATRSRQPVRIIRVPPTVRFLLEVTRIGELLEIADDEGPNGPPDIVA